LSTEASGVCRVAIVGGGISGLAAAHRLLELARDENRPLRVKLLEQQERVGGPLCTIRDGDLLLEAGPDQLVTHKLAGLDLCRRLGLGGDLVDILGKRFAPGVLHRGRPVQLPEGFAMLAPTRLGPFLRSGLFSWRGKVRVAAERFVPRRRATGDESLSSFVTRRFGKELLDRVAEPILAGIFTADADRMSMEMALPRFAALERSYGSVTGGMNRAQREAGPTRRLRRAGLVSLKRGFGSLVDRLVERLHDVEIRVDCRVTRIEPAAEGGPWTVIADGSAPLEVDRIILACPAYASSRMLSWDETLAGELARLEYAGCATVYLLYSRGAANRPVDGSGYFVPRTAGHPVLACSYVNNKFPDRAPAETLLLRVFLGGALHPETADLDDDALVGLSRAHVEAVLGIEGPPRFHRTFRYPRSMPQFGVGHRERIEALSGRLERYPGLITCGAAGGATGLPDCIAAGERAAHEALA
jgi:oxygen-dependent protoporphyrinogen oxidase